MTGLYHDCSYHTTIALCSPILLIEIWGMVVTFNQPGISNRTAWESILLSEENKRSGHRLLLQFAVAHKEQN